MGDGSAGALKFFTMPIGYFFTTHANNCGLRDQLLPSRAYRADGMQLHAEHSEGDDPITQELPTYINGARIYSHDYMSGGTVYTAGAVFRSYGCFGGWLLSSKNLCNARAALMPRGIFKAVLSRRYGSARVCIDRRCAETAEINAAFLYHSGP
jgi:hypothetical protein